MPVFPEVGSISVSPGFIRPDFSAFSTILRPIRSLRDPPALKNSHLAYSSQFKSFPIEFSLTTGVFPMAPKIFSKIMCFLSLNQFQWVILSSQINQITLELW
jgi:hypothetical protein